MSSPVQHVLEVLARDYPLMLSVAQAAEVIGVHPNTLHNWISAGRCPFTTRKVGGARRVSAFDLAHFIVAGSPMPRRGRPRKPVDDLDLPGVGRLEGGRHGLG